MNYIPRPGIVMVSVCGLSILVPSRAAFSYCKDIRPLSLVESIIWGGIEKDYPIEKVLNVYRILSKAPDEELISKIEAVCHTLCEKGFIIPKSAAREDEPS